MSTSIVSPYYFHPKFHPKLTLSRNELSRTSDHCRHHVTEITTLRHQLVLLQSQLSRHGDLASRHSILSERESVLSRDRERVDQERRKVEAYEKEREHMKSVVEEQDAQLRRIREEYAAKKKGMFAVCR